jgi:hypothetical protein
MEDLRKAGKRGLWRAETVNWTGVGEDGKTLGLNQYECRGEAAMRFENG